MANKAYLDYDGLKRYRNKEKTKFVTKNEMQSDIKMALATSVKNAVIPYGDYPSGIGRTIANTNYAWKTSDGLLVAFDNGGYYFKNDGSGKAITSALGSGVASGYTYMTGVTYNGNIVYLRKNGSTKELCYRAFTDYSYGDITVIRTESASDPESSCTYWYTDANSSIMAFGSSGTMIVYVINNNTMAVTRNVFYGVTSTGNSYLCGNKRIIYWAGCNNSTKKLTIMSYNCDTGATATLFNDIWHSNSNYIPSLSEFTYDATNNQLVAFLYASYSSKYYIGCVKVNLSSLATSKQGPLASLGGITMTNIPLILAYSEKTQNAVVNIDATHKGIYNANTNTGEYITISFSTSSQDQKIYGDKHPFTQKYAVWNTDINIHKTILFDPDTRKFIDVLTPNYQNTEVKSVRVFDKNKAYVCLTNECFYVGIIEEE